MFSYLCSPLSFHFSTISFCCCLEPEQKEVSYSMWMINQDCCSVGYWTAACSDNVCAFVTWNQNIETDLSNGHSYATKTIAAYSNHLSSIHRGISRIASRDAFLKFNENWKLWTKFEQTKNESDITFASLKISNSRVERKPKKNIVNNPIKTTNKRK